MNNKNKLINKLIPNGGYFDYSLLAVVIILICFGLVMLYSASAYDATSTFGNDMYFLKRQVLTTLLALALMAAVMTIDYHTAVKLAPYIFVLSIVLMAMVKFSPFGVEVNGARRWLRIGIQFQPSEIAKIAVILILVYMIRRFGRDADRYECVFVMFVVGFLPGIAAYYFTENLSTALIIIGICAGIIFVSHPKTLPFVILFIVIAAAAAVLLIYLIHNYENSDSFRIVRIMTWRNPEKYPDLGGWQVLQGLYAIGSGGFFGKGLGNSTQKLDIIPEAQNDMIFSIICEELGLFGAIIVVLLFSYLLFRLVVIAQNAPDKQGALIATGVFIHIALQVILNISVVLNVIPTTGITLPWISYGGTSVLFLMAEIGLVLRVSAQIEPNSIRPVRRVRSGKRKMRSTNQ